MQSFEDVRAHLAAQFKIDHNEPYLLSLELLLPEGRRQEVFVAELKTEHAQRVLRVGTPIRRFAGLDAKRCLCFNWAQRTGWLAVGELDGEDYLHLCENRPYAGLDGAALDRLLIEVAAQADGLERLLAGGSDLT